MAARFPSPDPLPHRLLGLGHSHMRRLKEFMTREDGVVAGSSNFLIDHSQLSSTLIGFGGIRCEHLLAVGSHSRSNARARLGPHRHVPGVVARAFESMQPDSLILWIGDNDIAAIDDGRSPHDIGEELAYNIMAKASTLKRRYQLTQVYVVQLLPRYFTPRSRSTLQEIARYNEIAFQVNQVVYNEALEMNLDKHHLGFIFPQEDQDQHRYVDMRKYFLPDGVHLNSSGYRKCFKSMRHIAIKSAQE